MKVWKWSGFVFHLGKHQGLSLLDELLPDHKALHNRLRDLDLVLRTIIHLYYFSK